MSLVACEGGHEVLNSYRLGTFTLGFLGALLIALVLLGLAVAPSVSTAGSYSQLTGKVSINRAFSHFTGMKGESCTPGSGAGAAFIYYPSLSQGVGSNDLGLDRGRLGQTQLVQFERVGPRLLLVASTPSTGPVQRPQ